MISYKVILFLAYYATISLANQNVSTLCKPTSFCSNSTMISKEVLDYCKSKNASIMDRCCLTNQSIIIGVDFSNCGLTNVFDLVALIKTINKTDETIEILDVRQNSIEECSKKDFINFFHLNEFYFSNNCTCPGSNFSWASTSNDRCIGQINICQTNFTNVNCTEESYCTPNGPGNFLCLCKPGFHGYKCLKEGQFPTLSFTLSFCLGTLFLCGLLYHTQRRHSKKD